MVTGVHSLSLKALSLNVLLDEEDRSSVAPMPDVGVDRAVPAELLST